MLTYFVCACPTLGHTPRCRYGQTLNGRAFGEPTTIDGAGLSKMVSELIAAWDEHEEMERRRLLPQRLKRWARRRWGCHAKRNR